ncbi:hypothetical protein HDK77DRAFT_503698 [Phyllosticta capitalensis]
MPHEQDARKRKRSVSDHDAMPPPPLKTSTTDRRIFLAGRSEYFAVLIVDPNETDAQWFAREASKEHAERLDEFRAVVYFLHHKIEEKKLWALLGNPGSSLRYTLLSKMAQANWDEMYKIKNQVERFVRQAVLKAVEDNKKKNKMNSGFVLHTMSPEERMHHVWNPIFRADPIKFTRAMFRPIDHIIDFVVIFDTPESASGEMKALMTRWKTFILQNWLAAADAYYRCWHLHTENPDTADIFANNYGSYGKLWEKATETMDVPGWEEIPIRLSLGNEMSKRLKAEHDKGDSYVKFGWGSGNDEDPVKTEEGEWQA